MDTTRQTSNWSAFQQTSYDAHTCAVIAASPREHRSVDSSRQDTVTDNPRSVIAIMVCELYFTTRTPCHVELVDGYFQFHAHLSSLQPVNDLVPNCIRFNQSIPNNVRRSMDIMLGNSTPVETTQHIKLVVRYSAHALRSSPTLFADNSIQVMPIICLPDHILFTPDQILRFSIGIPNLIQSIKRVIDLHKTVGVIRTGVNDHDGSQGIYGTTAEILLVSCLNNPSEQKLVVQAIGRQRFRLLGIVHSDCNPPSVAHPPETTSRSADPTIGLAEIVPLPFGTDSSPTARVRILPDTTRTTNKFQTPYYQFRTTCACLWSQHRSVIAAYKYGDDDQRAVSPHPCPACSWNMAAPRRYLANRNDCQLISCSIILAIEQCCCATNNDTRRCDDHWEGPEDNFSLQLASTIINGGSMWPIVSDVARLAWEVGRSSWSSKFLFWVIRNVPMIDYNFMFDNRLTTADRLREIFASTRRLRSLLKCRQCGTVVADLSDCFSVTNKVLDSNGALLNDISDLISDAHGLPRDHVGNYRLDLLGEWKFLPGDVVALFSSDNDLCEALTLRRTRNTRGNKMTRMSSWFAGFGRADLSCFKCEQNLGWKFVIAPSIFHAIHPNRRSPNFELLKSQVEASKDYVIKGRWKDLYLPESFCWLLKGKLSFTYE